jgi:hypothetical protein
MSQHYSDPARANEPHALPDIEVFYVDLSQEIWSDAMSVSDSKESGMASGWYWWSCFPGCLPDGEPFGPFATEAEALGDAQRRRLMLAT